MKIKIKPLTGATTSGSTLKNALVEKAHTNHTNSTAKAEPSQAKSSGQQVEILDTPPTVLRRPLALVDGHAYAASWLFVKVTLTESTDEEGKLIKHNPPKIIEEKRLMIMRDDGLLFNDGTRSLDDLGFSVDLQESPQANKLWSSLGIKRYRNNERIDPEILFQQICDVINTFIDFDRSFADQKEMCEFIACYILATWFLDAFNVIGFVWPNGERGSGKTQLLTIISQLSYLGQLVLAGGSFASLRDLADYGATICFDDAENLSDPKKLDGDKRALLLASNRRGSTVTLKELNKDKKWQTRYVNTYCPRAFSAINLPDPVLASRTIIVPLVRTTDKLKANSEPQDMKKWPHDLRRLIDDLWSLALANLQDFTSYESKVNERSLLTGRNLEPWKAILAVSQWLEDQGVSGLWERMNKLSHNYQKERQEFESDDPNTLIIRALCRCIGCEVVELCEVSEVSSKSDEVFITTSDIEYKALEVVQELESDIDADDLTSRKIGRKLAKMRFRKGREGGTGRAGWYVSRQELAGWARSLGLLTPNE